ncbi:MAG TPA: serine/threonine-protein kinase, partial [Gemmataceae bacterium]|nr:serine/threonine-protein kinase [Gemmataceae bacterium]
MSCLQRAELKCFLAGELSAPAAAELALHVENCAACEQALAELTDNESLPLKSEPTGDADATKLEPTGEVLNRLHASLPRTSGLHPPLGRSRTSWHSEPRIAAGDTAAVAVPPAVPGYEILCELSRGGMGVVYKARQVALNRVVALKMVLIEAHAGHARLARFRTEAEAVARLQHPNIVQIYDIGEHAGCPYFSMELIDGPTLTEACGGRPQSPGSAAALAEALARAIHSAHLQGIIHRDLKPDNILLVFSREPLAGATSALAGGSRLNEAVPKII